MKPVQPGFLNVFAQNQTMDTVGGLPVFRGQGQHLMTVFAQGSGHIAQWLSPLKSNVSGLTDGHAL